MSDQTPAEPSGSMRSLKPHLERAGRLALVPGKVGWEMARAAAGVAMPALRREIRVVLGKEPEVP
jgi:hypothetical protein